MADDGSKIGIGQLVEGVAVGERVRLDFEIVEVGYALYGRFGIVAALAILIVELAAQGLLVTQSDLFDGQSNFLSRFVAARCCQLIAARHVGESDTLNKLTDADLTAIISHGGPALNKSALMPAWGSTLSRSDIQALISYVRAISDPPNRNAGPVYPQN